MAISARGLIGSYFFHNSEGSITVNQYTYQDCLKWFVAELKKRKQFKHAVFMQDGTMPHTALSTREYLKNTFRTRLIGKHLEHEWPASSPDMTLADFWLCQH